MMACSNKVDFLRHHSIILLAFFSVLQKLLYFEYFITSHLNSYSKYFVKLKTTREWENIYSPVWLGNENTYVNQIRLPVSVWPCFTAEIHQKNQISAI